MDRETLQIRYLIVITAILCAVMIGYNAFYVPDISMSDITVTTDTSETNREEYTPKEPSSSQSIGQAESGRVSEKPESVEPKASSDRAKPAATGKININTATAQQLSDGLDGIGEVMAKRIIEYREKNGRFHSIEEIKNVQGIGDKTFAKLKDQITVS